MSRLQISSWRITLATGLIAAALVVSASSRIEGLAEADPAPQAHARSGPVPCPDVGPRGVGRIGPGDRARIIVAIIIGCRWESRDPNRPG